MTSDQTREDGQAVFQVRLVAPTDFSAVPSFYSNYAQVGMSPHDFVLHFSRYSVPIITEPPAVSSSVDVVPQPVASVSIPLNLVRGLIRALEGQVENWEKNFRQPLPAEPSQSIPTEDSLESGQEVEQR